MARRGKIARLAKSIREELNNRLQNGEEGEPLVAWLNSLPGVQKAVAENFGGYAITEQNLSEWRKGGYREWERQEESSRCLRELLHESKSLKESGAKDLGEGLTTVMAMEAAKAAEALLAESDKLEPRERLQRCREVLGLVSLMRREDRKTGWLTMEQERRERALKQQAKEEWKRAMLNPVLAQWELPTFAKGLGGENGMALAAYILEIAKDLPPGSLGHGLKDSPSEEKPVDRSDPFVADLIKKHKEIHGKESCF